MGSAGSNTTRELIGRTPNKADRAAAMQGLLFVIPSLSITLISYVLFTLLEELTARELNVFSITVMSAIVLSLLGTAGVQFLIYGEVDESKCAANEAESRVCIRRGAEGGLTYALVFSLVAAAGLYPYFVMVLDFSLAQFLHFVALLSFYSMTWVLTASFWAVGENRYPAIIFPISYLVLFALTYAFYLIGPVYTISGYTLGIGVLLWLSVVAAYTAFRGESRAGGSFDARSSKGRSLSGEYSGILLHTFLILAIFLDKIVVWVSEGLREGTGLLIVGPYTSGAFLGLVPAFSVAAVAYFSYRTRPVAHDMYQGTLLDIRNRIAEYRRTYSRGFRAMLMLTLVLFCVIVPYGYFFVRDAEVFRILVTISVGVFFFVGIVFNSVVLPMFGKTGVAALSMFAVVLCVSVSALFVGVDVWYASVGFLVGSVLGFIVSDVYRRRLFAAFEYNMFRLLPVAG
jgi:hypothetical protein